MIEKIISGGQTGVDLAALDSAILFSIPHGGWCPKGRINEKGTIHKKYQLIEVFGEYKTEQDCYDLRTKSNIKDSDGTLILIPKIPLPYQIKDGTLLTIDEAKKIKKPSATIDLSQPNKENIEIVLKWIIKEKIKLLNIAGPRESTCPGIYEISFLFLKNLFLCLGFKLHNEFIKSNI